MIALRRRVRADRCDSWGQGCPLNPAVLWLIFAFLRLEQADVDGHVGQINATG